MLVTVAQALMKREMLLEAVTPLALAIDDMREA